MAPDLLSVSEEIRGNVLKGRRKRIPAGNTAEEPAAGAAPGSRPGAAEGDRAGKQIPEEFIRGLSCGFVCSNSHSSEARGPGDRPRGTASVDGRAGPPPGGWLGPVPAWDKLPKGTAPVLRPWEPAV